MKTWEQTAEKPNFVLQNSSPLFPFKLGLKACLVNNVDIRASKNQTRPCPWLSAKHGVLGVKGVFFFNNQCNKLCDRFGGGGVIVVMGWFF